MPFYIQKYLTAKLNMDAIDGFFSLVLHLRRLISINITEKFGYSSMTTNHLGKENTLDDVTVNLFDER